MVCYKNHVHVEDIFSILQARGSMLRTTAHHERALQVRPISSPTILFFGDANLVYSTSGGMLARPYFEPKFEPYFPPRPKSTTSPFVENVSFILLKEMESSSSCVRSENRCIMLLRFSARTADFEDPLKREMQRKETAFIKPSATKERTAVAAGSFTVSQSSVLLL